MAELYRTEPLANGLSVSFFNLTNRYYGDFHRVCIQVQIQLPIEKMQLSVEQQKLIERLKSPPCFERQLERMGVVSADVDSIMGRLVDDFLTTSRPYLEKVDFAQRLLQKKLAEKPTRRSLRGG